MTRRHSLFTRCLAVLLALVLIASNGSIGLALGAKAAETGNLFDLMSENGASNAKLDAVLAYADYMPELKAMNVSVEYDEEPTAAVGTLRQGTLTVEEIGAWLPMSYYLPGSTTPEYFGGDYTVEGLGEDTASVNVVYTLTPVDPAEVQAVQMWVHELAAVPAAQAEALGTLSTGNKLTALKVLEYEFISGLSADVDAIKASDLGIELTAEDLDITTEDILAELGLSADIQITEEIQAEIDAKVQEKINAEIDKEVETVKVEFKGVIEKLLARLVDNNDPYSKILNDRGNPKYLDYLRIYAMMNEYSINGLPFYYENADEIVKEMEALSAVLGEILGEANEDSINYNKKAMQYLLDKGEYGVKVSQIESLKTQMDEGAATLRAQQDNLSIVTSKIDTENCDDLKGLLDALAAFDLTGCKMGIFMYSEQLSIVDDSWKFITTTVNGTPVNVKFATDAVLTEADIEAAVAQIEAAAPHYTVDTSAVKALVGTKMSANVTVECEATPKTYEVEIEDGETLTIYGDATELVLPYKKGHEITYAVNGEEVVVTNEESATIKLTSADLDKIAANTFAITIVEDIDVGKVSWEGLVEDLNEALGREAFVVDDETLIANITLGELGAFAKVVFNNEINSILLNGQPFLSNVENSYIISIQTLIDALLCDASFTSQKLINLGTNGSGNLLNSTIEIFDSQKNFVLNLPSVPAQMGTVAKGLNAVKDYFWFQSSGPIQGRSVDSEVAPYLNVSVNLPEKVYEAYLTAAILSGRITKNDADKVKNKVAMEFMANYMELLVNSDADVTTLENTLASLGADMDLSQYNPYYSLLKKAATSDGFSYEIAEETVDFYQKGTGEGLKALLAAMGLDYTELTMGQDVIDDYEQIHGTAVVTLVNEVPEFDALVIDPARLNNEGIKAKVMAANYVTNLPTASIEGPAAIMLMSDVDGDLTFNRTTILDLNGFKVNGNITANAPVYIVDSCLETVSGAAVTGKVSGDAHILAGTYSHDVSAFLKDGYYMDGNSVVNAVYQIVDGNIVIDGNIYLDYVDGYLPAVHYVAADVAIDLILNSYFTAGISVEGNNLYAIRFEDIIGILQDKNIGGLADQTLACINAAGMSDFVNTVIADLMDFASIETALSTNTSLGTYTFEAYPFTVDVHHDTNADQLTFDVVPSSNANTYNLGLTIKIPEGQKKQELLKVISALANHVVAEETEILVTLDQPVRDGKNLVVGGSGTASITLDFSKNDKYNRMLAGVLAYFNDGLTDELVENGCIIDLNKKMSVVTVGEFFTAVEGAIENPEITFADIAAKLNVELTESELAKLEELYDDFQIVCAKIIDKFDLTTNASAPLSELANGDGEFIVNGDIQPHTADAYLKGFGLIANLGYTDATLVVRLAPKCTQILGDANWDGDVNILDVIVLNRYVVNLITSDEIHMCVCDLNGDGDVNVLDLILLNRYVVKEISKFPVEE